MRMMQQKRLDLKNNQFPEVDITSKESEIKINEPITDSASLTQIVNHNTEDNSSEVNEEVMRQF
tara:strand:- start:384 stop:575 length:192 start_codon:yes stop_codon:yes gene_type:complete